MWDPVHHRLTVIPDSFHSHRLDIPESVTVWDYGVDQVTEYKLPDVKLVGVPLRPLD